MIKIVDCKNRALKSFNARAAFPQEAEDAAFAVLAEIKKSGDEAVAAAVAKFEGAKLKPSQFRLKNLSIEKLEKSIDPVIVKAVKDAHRRV
jgi:histidinol dehydrogenase